jgi:predicted nucleic acid-binding Zn ribbon protein
VPLDAPGGDDPVRVDSLLDRVADRLGGPRTDVVAAIFGHWNELVGESVAARSRPVSLRDGRLLVIAEDGAWATQLRFLTADLIGRISEKVGPGTVSEITIRVDRDQGGGGPARPPRRNAPG